VAGPTFFRCLYDNRYADAGWYAQWLAAAAWLAVLQAAREVVLLAVGRTRAIALGQAAKLAALPPLLALGLHLWGVTGLIVGYALAELPRYAVLTWELRGRALPVVRYDLVLTLLLAASCGLVLGVGPALWGGWPAPARLAAEAAAVTLFWGVALAAWWPHGGPAVRRLLRREG